MTGAEADAARGLHLPDVHGLHAGTNDLSDVGAVVVLPQAIKNILPALGNEFVTVIKESSIVSVIGLADLMFRTRNE